MVIGIAGVKAFYCPLVLPRARQVALRIIKFREVSDRRRAVLITLERRSIAVFRKLGFTKPVIGCTDVIPRDRVIHIEEKRVF